MGKKAFRSTAGRMLSIFMILFLVMAVSVGCNSSSGGGSKDDTSENGSGTGDTGGNGGTGGSDDTGGNGGSGDTGGSDDDPSCKVVLLEDDFSGSLTTNWTRGTNTLTNPGGPTVAIDNQEVLFSQNYDYIETKQAFYRQFPGSGEPETERGGWQHPVCFLLRGTGGPGRCFRHYAVSVWQ